MLNVKWFTDFTVKSQSLPARCRCCALISCGRRASRATLHSMSSAQHRQERRSHSVPQAPSTAPNHNCVPHEQVTAWQAAALVTHSETDQMGLLAPSSARSNLEFAGARTLQHALAPLMARMPLCRFLGAHSRMCACHSGRWRLQPRIHRRLAPPGAGVAWRELNGKSRRVRTDGRTRAPIGTWSARWAEWALPGEPFLRRPPHSFASPAPPVHRWRSEAAAAGREQLRRARARQRARVSWPGATTGQQAVRRRARASPMVTERLHSWPDRPVGWTGDLSGPSAGLG